MNCIAEKFYTVQSKPKSKTYFQLPTEPFNVIFFRVKVKHQSKVENTCSMYSIPPTNNTKPKKYVSIYFPNLKLVMLLLKRFRLTYSLNRRVNKNTDISMCT